MNGSREKAVCTLVAVAVILCGMSGAHAQVAAPGWMKGSSRSSRQSSSRNTAKPCARTRVAAWNRSRSSGAPRTVARPFSMSSCFRISPGTRRRATEMFDRFEGLLDKLNGHMTEIGLAFRWQTDLDIGPILPVDEIFAGYDPSAHIGDDFFQNKIAFVVLLNYPLTTLDQRLTDGAKWSRRQWAEARLAQRFSKRIPADVNLEVAKIGSRGRPVHLRLQHLDAPPRRREGEPAFPRGDEAPVALEPSRRAQGGLSGQEERSRQAAHDPAGDGTDRHPDDSRGGRRQSGRRLEPVHERGEAGRGEGLRGDAPIPANVTNSPEPDTRYAILLSTFKAAKLVDPYSPTAPTLIARRFDENREIPEARVREMLVQVVSSPLVPKVAKLIEERLGRKLEPFDIWYNGFRAKSLYSQEELDKIVAQKYPNAAAFEKDIPNILMKLGFSNDRAAYIAKYIAVDPARGSGHASGGGMRGATAHLRTRLGKNGMDYKGFNIAVHELGHNVEQVLSLNDVDHTLLQGVPNTAFTEGVRVRFPGPRSRDSRARREARRDGRGAQDAERFLGRLRDFGRFARRHGGLALDVRSSGGDSRPSSRKP